MSTWIKLHDNFWENPKVLSAGEDAALLYIQGLSYCSRNLTDGAIPKPALRNLTAKKDARTLARILVREGLWIETAGGWQVHDYLTVQRSREQVEVEREKARERQRKARVTAQSRRDSGRTSGEVTGTVRVPDTETDTETENPSPLEPIWQSYAVLKARGTDVGDFSKWSIPVIANAKAEHAGRAEFLAQRFDATPLQIAAALISGDCRALDPYKRKASA